MANNLDFGGFVAGQTLLDVGGFDNSSLLFQVNGEFYSVTDGHAAGGGPGPNETVVGGVTTLGAGA